MTSNNNTEETPVISPYLSISLGGTSPYFQSQSPHHIPSVLKQKSPWRYLLSVFCSRVLPSKPKWKPRCHFLSEMNSWIHASAHCGEESSAPDKAQIPKSTQEKVIGLVIRLYRAPGETQAGRDCLGKPIPTWPWIAFGFDSTSDNFLSEVKYSFSLLEYFFYW